MIRTAIHTPSTGMIPVSSLSELAGKHARVAATAPNTSVWMNVEPGGELAPILKDAPKVEDPFHLYIEASVDGHYTTGPGWAMVHVTQKFVDNLYEILAITRLAVLSSATRSIYPNDWHDCDEHRVIDTGISVERHGAFQFLGYLKYSDAPVRTKELPLEILARAIELGVNAMDTGNAQTKWNDGDLLFCPSGDFDGLIELIAKESESAA